MNQRKSSAAACIWVLSALILLLPRDALAALEVDSVVQGGPAERAGLKADDVISAVGGREVDNLDQLAEALAGKQPGDVVEIHIDRGQRSLRFELSLGPRVRGKGTLGVKLRIDPEGESTRGTLACQEWIEETYQVHRLISELDLGPDFSAMEGDVLTCVRGDTQRMASEDAIRFCDNIFKVHCSGVDLLTEIGEGLIQRCADELGQDKGAGALQLPAWKSCGQNLVYDRYSTVGKVVAAGQCVAFIERECA